MNLGSISDLADMRPEMIRQLEARATIYRVGNGLVYNDDDAAIDDLAAAALRDQLRKEGAMNESAGWNVWYLAVCVGAAVMVVWMGW